MPACSHVAGHVLLTELPDATEGCEDCLAQGGVWLHLRICLECGRVGCCDSSPGRHASAHGRDAGHPLMRSIEPGEEWAWCFEHEAAMRLAQVQGQTRIPPSPMGREAGPSAAGVRRQGHPHAERRVPGA